MKNYKASAWFASIRVATLLGVLAAVPESRATNVLWQSPKAILGDSDVKNVGTLIGAYSFGQHVSGTTVATVNGVAFKGALFNTTQGYVTSAAATDGYNGFGGTSTPFLSLSTPYKTLLARGIYKASGALTVTVSGLTANKTYLVQCWFNDSRGNPGAALNQVRLTAASNTSAEVFPMRTAVTPGTVGQYIVGYLTLAAGETAASIVVSPSSTSNFTQVNALQIREVAEPSAWLQDERYGLFVHWLPGLTNIPAVSSTLAKIPSGQTDSLWSSTVAGFDVEAFADQAQETGAAYVIFSVGQTSGFYCSYNSAYESMTVALPPSGAIHGPIYRGEFTSHRDLISDMADALKERGIKMMVYLAAEGPRVDNYVQRTPGGQQIYPSVITSAREGATGAYSQTFRTNFNSIVQEWSNRWGSKVAGWWFDGCWNGTGYSNSGSDNGQGLNNLNALIAAAKSGNAAAVVACNPGADIFTALSPQQDFIAGELGRSYDSFSKFYEYPATPYLNLSGKNIQWHVLSYLGSWWAEGDTKYATDELVMYIDSVNRMGGVVTIDVAVDKEGNILTEHLEQMKDVKSFLNPAARPTSPSKDIPSNNNLALYRPAYFKSNINGARLNASMGYQLQPHAGVDGDSATYAQAAGEYAFTYVVDLEKVQNFNRVAVTFRNTSFATSYEVKYSNTGVSGPWTAINSSHASYSNSSGGLKVHDADATKTGRWVMIKALAPNAAGQTGQQMSIEEFAVYNANGTAQTAKDTMWVDEEVPTGSTLQTGGSGLWNWSSVRDVNWSSLGMPWPLSGLKVHWSPSASGWSERSFETSPAPLSVGVGDSLYCYVWIDPADIPSQILLSWKDSSGSWEHRAYWGSNSISTGAVSGTNALRNMGAMPAGGAFRLVVPASDVGLEGQVITGMRFSTFDGRVVFDRVGRSR